jgi:potassium channel subfamily K protein 9
MCVCECASFIGVGDVFGVNGDCALEIAGYGHSTPSTVGGEIFCMFYALAGIPLGLVMFQSIGERLNTFVAFVLRKIKHCFGKDPVVTHMNLIIVASGCGSLVMAAGAFAFHRFEGWEVSTIVVSVMKQ